MSITKKLNYIYTSDYTRINQSDTITFMFNGVTQCAFSDLPYCETMTIHTYIKKKKTVITYYDNTKLLSIYESDLSRRGISKIITNIECVLCNTEEQYFQESTIHDLTNYTLDDFILIGEIYKKYYTIIRYGK